MLEFGRWPRVGRCSGVQARGGDIGNHDIGRNGVSRGGDSCRHRGGYVGICREDSWARIWPRSSTTAGLLLLLLLLLAGRRLLHETSSLGDAMPLRACWGSAAVVLFAVVWAICWFAAWMTSREESAAARSLVLSAAAWPSWSARM